MVVAGVRLRRHKLHIVQNNFLLFELKLFITHCVVPPFPKKLTLFGYPDIYFSVYIYSFYYAVHNHPDNGCLSLGDLINFLKRQNMLGLEAIGKNGYNSSIIIKTLL